MRVGGNCRQTRGGWWMVGRGSCCRNENSTALAIHSLAGFLPRSLSTRLLDPFGEIKKASPQWTGLSGSGVH